MKTATVRDLRNNFARLETWLAEGESIEIHKRGELVAVLAAPPRMPSDQNTLPDFKARRKAIWGKRVFSLREVEQMRADERMGEEG